MIEKWSQNGPKPQKLASTGPKLRILRMKTQNTAGGSIFPVFVDFPVFLLGFRIWGARMGGGGQKNPANGRKWGAREGFLAGKQEIGMKTGGGKGLRRVFLVFPVFLLGCRFFCPSGCSACPRFEIRGWRSEKFYLREFAFICGRFWAFGASVGSGGA